MRTPLLVALTLASIALRALPQETLHLEALEEIHLTGDCRIYNREPLDKTAEKKPRYFRDAGICHQESKKHLKAAENTLKDGALVRVNYKINESDYLLHNFTSHPVAFVLDQPLPAGWHVITDPQPISTDDHLAIYRVLAQPGQTVRLHTGQRR